MMVMPSYNCFHSHYTGEFIPNDSKAAEVLVLGEAILLSLLGGGGGYGKGGNEWLNQGEEVHDGEDQLLLLPYPYTGELTVTLHADEETEGDAPTEPLDTIAEAEVVVGCSFVIVGRSTCDVIETRFLEVEPFLVCFPPLLVPAACFSLLLVIRFIKLDSLGSFWSAATKAQRQSNFTATATVWEQILLLLQTAQLGSQNILSPFPFFTKYMAFLRDC